eukprot:TRINITY_DN9496_c0_g1_i1.p3 TRINITY_DN9496_c0_g1~~TRINITY_DN9496_c0_g1_i1.p3  ORF type:complete len:100 (-),score=26.09 TRINITY_DN9496_c0_g1_i1:11-310(-)
MAQRTLRFVRAGDNDVSEVTISTGTHIAGAASVVARETYTISYPGGGGGSGGGKTLKAKFEDAAQAVIDDAAARGVQIGEIGRAVQQECRDRSRMPSSA